MNKIISTIAAAAVCFIGIQVASLGNAATAAITITKQPVFLMICIITALNIAVLSAQFVSPKDEFSTLHPL